MAYNKHSMANNDDVKTAMNSGTNAAAAFNYDDAFPALPTGLSDGLKPKTSSGCETVPPAVQQFPYQIRNMRIHSSEVTQVLCVPAEERKYDQSNNFGEGESLRTCAQISKETGASIEISTSKDKSLTFMITGKQNNVLEARRKVLTSFQTQANISISIPKEHHRWILGKGGQRLKELEKSTGTKISMPGMNENSDKVTVTGTRENIEKALHEMRVISDEQSKKAFERIKVPKIYHPFITGPNNEKSAQLALDTNTRINIPPFSIDKDEITITGEREGVENAKNKILEIYGEMEKTCQSICVQIPKWRHKYVIGHKRSTIAEILKETGVSVEVPPVDQPIDSISLRGPYKLLGEALNLLYAKAQSMQFTEIDAPSRIHRLIIGKKGANIREFQEHYSQCHVEFMQDDKIRVEGPPDCLEEVTNKLQEKVNYYLNEYDIVELDVNRDHFKHIIGKNGVNVNRLKNDNDVSINISETPAKNSIKIEGAKQNVAQVKRELEEQIEKLENEKEREIVINQRHHRTLISNKREKLRELQDRYKVMIQFPGLNENNDLVRIKGLKEDVDACYEELSKIVKELNENSYTAKVPIFKQFHKCIIGRNGGNIKKIRDETETIIELPAEGDKSDTIMITGKKEKVEEAKERILKIQNEMIASRGLEDLAKTKQQSMETATEKQQSNLTVELRAKPEHHKFLIGKSGSRINKIRETTGARIIFPNEGDEDKELITIIGKKESVEKAKQELESIIQQICNTIEEYVHVNPKYHKHFIVNRGEVIHRISDDCGGVIISFPRNSSPDDSKVTIKGNPDCVKEAIKTIEGIVHDLENKFEDEVHVPPKYHKHFVMRKCEVLQNIIFECGGNDHVSVSFPRTDIKESRVQLKGVKESVQLAKTKILEIVKELEEQVTIEVVIPNKDHRAMLRSRRCLPTVDDIRKTHKVHISFPERVTADSHQPNGPGEVINGYVSEDEKDQPKPCDIVRITGKPENCEIAKQKLLEIAPITIELNVPYTYHHSIIGQKGALIQGIILKHDVSVEVPPLDLQLNVIKIYGRPAAVEDAKNDILKKKEEIETNSYEVKLDVPLEYHSHIIGRAGDVINKIRSDHNVQISLPKKNRQDETIVITGLQEKVEAAKAAIMEIVQRLESRYKEKVTIDRRVHSRMIGAKGRQVKKIMEEFNVEIRFPRENDPEPNTVIISGDEEKVLECKDHLLDLEDEYLEDVEQEEERTAVQNTNQSNYKNEASGFVVKGAPWDQKAPDTTSIAEFPSFGEDQSKTFAQLETKSKPVWGPRR